MREGVVHVGRGVDIGEVGVDAGLHFCEWIRDLMRSATLRRTPAFELRTVRGVDLCFRVVERVGAVFVLAQPIGVAKRFS